MRTMSPFEQVLEDVGASEIRAHRHFAGVTRRPLPAARAALEAESCALVIGLFSTANNRFTWAVTRR
jgi:hypothetical protein